LLLLCVLASSAPPVWNRLSKVLGGIIIIPLNQPKRK
jgi:hypothetical protein